MNSIDITKDICPITFVKVKLKLEEIKAGELLEVFLSEGEPIQNVPRSLKDEGHKVITVEKLENKYRLVVEKENSR
jgi:tRNA 2-thiouridine synthesizing protein A